MLARHLEADTQTDHVQRVDQFVADDGPDSGPSWITDVRRGSQPQDRQQHVSEDGILMTETETMHESLSIFCEILVLSYLCSNVHFSGVSIE